MLWLLLLTWNLGWTSTGQVALPWTHYPFPQPPCPPNVLYLLEGGPYAGPNGSSRFLFSCQMAAKIGSGTGILSEKMAPLSTLWRLQHELVVVLATHTCPGRSQGHCFYQAWEVLSASLWGLITVAFAIVMRHGHMLFCYKEQSNTCSVGARDPLLHTYSVPKSPANTCILLPRLLK